MENATKALTMAAGVLIAMMVMALVYLLLNQISDTSTQEDLQLKAEQTATFNKEYESYQKKLLRGTEVITIINKAISNNVKYEDQDKIYDVNVIFKLATAVEGVIVEVKNGVETKTPQYRTDFNADVVYELIDYSSPERINQDIYLFMEKGAYEITSDDGIIVEYIDEKNYTKEYDNFKVFKRKFFKCTEVGYSEQTGRVNLLVFEELKQSDELMGYD